MWRFKTKEEVIEQYGIDYRNNGFKSWNSSGKMDELFGQVISEEYKESILDCLSGKIKFFNMKHTNSMIGFWNIHKHMLVKIRTTPYTYFIDKYYYA